MKAALLTEPGKPMEIGEVDIDQPGPREVLIKTRACGLCRSDLHFIDGVYPHPLPTIPGHEAAGVVEAVGSEVGHVSPGDHVITFLAPFCGTCDLCQSGKHTLCTDLSTKRAEGAPPRLSMGGEPLPQFLNLSGFAEKMLVHENACVAIDPEMPMDRAALIGCSVITGAGSIFNDCGLRPGESVAVVGTGGIGLSAINAAKIAGAGEIIAIDPVASKRALAEKMGATMSFDAGDEDVDKQVLKATGGGVDYAVEAVGRPETAQLAWNILKRGGTATILGMIAPGKMVELHGPTFLAGKRIQGSLMGSSHFMRDMPRLVSYYLDGRLDLDSVIAERISLEQVNDGFEKLRQGDSARSVIMFD
ncbi:Zn-dependent alcohol dehydrogenase [Parasphingopyxis marina]|uniref:Zn-dependent alcohol dehydrogenase n=1 Tax=Parasphingopyxis marina TaxID=2761622 RepID=A0A842HWJ2_9SPHN|nr:Zn-dependent alcohol dehydrogenase [Parasphingopyxis marina]MBC2778478.1 Zn-dependent alcohol dehydrogenase [Parasphingopyxis marina]